MPPQTIAPQVGGQYDVAVRLQQNDCPAAPTVLPQPTSVTHVAGASAFTLAHGGLVVSGSVARDGAFTTQTLAVQDPQGPATLTTRGTLHRGRPRGDRDRRRQRGVGRLPLSRGLDRNEAGIPERPRLRTVYSSRRFQRARKGRAREACHGIPSDDRCETVVCRAIREHRVLSFVYYDKLRIVEPYCHGVTP